MIDDDRTLWIGTDKPPAQRPAAGPLTCHVIRSLGAHPRASVGDRHVDTTPRYLVALHPGRLRPMCVLNYAC